MPVAQLRIALLLEEGYDDDEVALIAQLFESADASLTIVAPFPGRLYSGRDGLIGFTSDLAAGAVRAQMFSAIVIAGGYAPDRLRMRHAVLDLVREAISAEIPVGAIGHGPQVLISAAAVSGRTMTCWPSIAIDIKNAGGLYVDRPVVEDKGIITARKVDDVRPFVETILRAIASRSR